jgi:hypothetical protein
VSDLAVPERAGVVGESTDHLVGVLVERDGGFPGARVVERQGGGRGALALCHGDLAAVRRKAESRR